MADTEVENTLREIRARVLADAGRPASGAGALAATASSGSTEAARTGEPSSGAGEALMRMDANLSTTARAWSRLPPLLSYRRGMAARLELWLKGLVKRAAHWFTWEQVNFNSAVHHALGDVRAALAVHEQALASHERALARTQAELVASLRGLRAETESDRARVAELRARLDEAEARFDAGGTQLRRALAAVLERLNNEQAAAEVRAAAEVLREEQRTQIQARAVELHKEMRERVESLLEEQRTCFKQLSLEAGEAAVTYDRARRRLEARIDTLEKRKQGEGSGV
ncbi:MAG: hypothetical protein QOJ76_897 [Acidobacteriota bacterium]|jgi:tetratricopeptide (TPR) repeat protein|nr:hypothetical protein [Acidobacteriota bacterium]